MQTIWLSPTSFVTGDPTLRVSYPFVSHPSTIVSSTAPGDFKWVSLGLRFPPDVQIAEVIICYEVSNPRSFISQVRLSEMTTPDRATVIHDDPAHLTSTSPATYSSAVSGLVPSGAVTLELRLNFQNANDEILLGAVGIKTRNATERCVNSIVDLKALNGGAVQCLAVLGYHAPGDGGGGLFWWEDGVTIDDDGGTILVPTAPLNTGRWRRIYAGPLNVKWFGAKGDGTANDHDAIQRAVDAATAAPSQGGAVYFPGGGPDATPTTSGKYLTTSLSVTKPTVLLGDGRDKSSLVLSRSATSSLISATASLEMSGLRIDGQCGHDFDLIVFQGDGGDFVMRDCTLVDPKANGIKASRVNNRLMIQGCDFKFRGAGAYPSIFVFVDSATVDGGTISINENTFTNPTVAAMPGPSAIVLQGKKPDKTGGTQGVSADISGNYFYQMGTNRADGHPLGCIDIYNWVGRTTIARNRMYKPLYAAVKIGNSAGIVVSENIVAEGVSTSSGAAALFHSGYLDHPSPPIGPFHNVVIANNVVRNYPGGPGIHLASDSAHPALRHEITGNVVDAATSGIQLDGVGSVLIAENLICNCTGSSIYDGGVRMVRILATPTEQGEITIRGCTFLNNGGYGVFADGNYDNTALRVTVADCLFYGAIALTPFHVRLQSLTGNITSADIHDNRFRGTSGAVQVVSAGTLWMYNNKADTNSISIGPVATLLHSGNSWDATIFSLTVGLAALGSWTGSTTLTGADVGDTVTVGYDGFPNGLLSGGVSAAGTVQLTVFNAAAAFGPTTGNIRVSVSRHV